MAGIKIDSMLFKSNHLSACEQLEQLRRETQSFTDNGVQVKPDQVSVQLISSRKSVIHIDVSTSTNQEIDPQRS